MAGQSQPAVKWELAKPAKAWMEDRAVCVNKDVYAGSICFSSMGQLREDQQLGMYMYLDEQTMLSRQSNNNWPSWDS